MIGASKILTVSYGTFSCTLEGFDDPFNTMRAIAEYFRDLAADDRYFGAEPPTPDAAMLTRIAEREVQRRVEARIDSHGVTLRAEDLPTPRVTMPSVQAPAPAPAPVLASMAEAGHAIESAAARLSRLRAAQAQILAPTPAVSPAVSLGVSLGASLGDISGRFADVEAYAEDQDSEASFKPALVKPAPVKPAPVKLAAPEPLIAEPAVNLIRELDQVAPVAEAAEPEADAIPAAAEPVSDSLRETLAGLIGLDDQLAADMADATENAPASSARDFGASDDALPEDDGEFIDPTDASLPDTDLAEMAQFDAPVEATDDADLEDLAALDGTSPIIDDAADLLAEPAPDADVRDYPVAEAPINLAPVNLGPVNLAPVNLGPVNLAPVEASKRPEISVSPGAPVVAEKIQRARARVIKIRRLNKTPAGTPSEASIAAPLSPEAEADLQNTLAALEAEIAPATDDIAEAETSVEAQLDADLASDIGVTASQVARSEGKLAAADDAAVDRLLAQTNSALEVPETKRRRSAIAHLKAAVLATVGDRRNTPKAKDAVAEVKMNPYRKDLDQAVRPTTAILQGDRPAPLVLVSAQRIDRKRDAVADANRPVPQIVPSLPAPQPGPALPVRPRRVSSGSQGGALAQAFSTESVDDDESDLTPNPLGNIFADAGRQTFVEFAEGLGATSMAELIEAAGAYCTLVLERPSFTRPQLFQQISAIPQLADLNREDSLRSFGKLLRDGRIQKTVRGQYALSDTSPILTEAKRIAG